MKGDLTLKRSPLILAAILITVILSACSGERDKHAVNSTADRIRGEDNSTNPADSNISQVPSNETAFKEGVRIIKYPGDNACFTFETADGFQILSDPYMLTDTLAPDVVVESHQHGDHADTSQVEGDYALITEPGEYLFDKAVIKGYEGIHNKGDKEGTNYIFVTKIGGITIAHFASQADIPSEEVLEQIGMVDILLVQVFVKPDYNKLLPSDLPAIVDRLHPKIIIPEHGQSDASEVIARKLDIVSEAAPSGELILTREMLDDMKESKVINLDRIEE